MEELYRHIGMLYTELYRIQQMIGNKDKEINEWRTKYGLQTERLANLIKEKEEKSELSKSPKDSSTTTE